MEKSRKLFSTGKNQNTKQNIDNGRLNLTTFPPASHRTGLDSLPSSGSCYTNLNVSTSYAYLPVVK